MHACVLGVGMYRLIYRPIQAKNWKISSETILTSLFIEIDEM